MAIKLLDILSDGPSAGEDYTGRIGITVQGLATKPDKLIEQYGVNFLDKMQSFYGDADESQIIAGIVAQEGPFSELDRIDKQRILNASYFKTQTLEEKLAVQQEDPAVTPAGAEVQPTNNDSE